MNSVVVHIIVEGATEQTFVRDVLAPQIAHEGIYLNPRRIGTPGHKGGDVRFDRAKTDICQCLRERNDTYVSTMFDYFRIDSKWPGKEEVNRQIKTGASLTAIGKAEMLEAATHNEIVRIFSEYDSENRFIPYIEMHEFEALLFSDADILSEKTETNVSQIREILEEYDNNPEEINDNPVNTPSKRLNALTNGYRKVAMGKTVAEAIGIQTMRRQCSHFNDWLIKLERLKRIAGEA